MQSPSLPSRVSLPSCKSPMFQPAGAGVRLDLSWREHIPSLRSPSCPRLSAGVMLEVKQASQEQHLPVTAVTSREGAEHAPCTPVPFRTLRSALGLRVLLSSQPPSSRFFLSPRHLSTPGGTTATPHLQPTHSFHVPPRLTSGGRRFLLTTQSRESARRGRGSFRITQAPPTSTTSTM